MAFNQRLLPHAFQSLKSRPAAFPSTLLTRSIHSNPPSGSAARFIRARGQPPRPSSRDPIALVKARANPTESKVNWANWQKGTMVGVGLVGLNLAWTAGGEKGGKKVWCESPVVPPPPPSRPEPASIVNPYELGFGAVCGICAGVFIKKGAKLIAFILGGAFVFLQYLNSINLVKVNWTKIGSRYDSLTTSNGEKGVLTVTRLWNWITDFLTRDFQQRATFLGGLALGIRVG
ncbi:FUN14 [Phaffia rhodozyma]|uniref:FUN14 n=1 Tax=Phaffia rhodozyma TaxID=264483 RepID=A0A0F7SHP7_PHARH|nr:FUN14 [Phaffia rhodozyma]